MRFIVLWSIKCIFCFPRIAAAIIQLWNTHLLPVLHKCACSFSIQRNFAICAQLHCPSNDAIISALHKVWRIKPVSMGISHWFLSHHKTLLNISCLMSFIIRVWLALQGIFFFSLYCFATEFDQNERKIFQYSMTYHAKCDEIEMRIVKFCKWRNGQIKNLGLTRLWFCKV